MTHILLAGVAVLDFIFDVAEFPTSADKHRALDSRIVNGGNSANAAIALAKMGATPLLAARLGDDPVADLIISGLKRHGVDCSLIRRFSEARSSYSSIFIDPAGERQIVNFRDTTIGMDPAWLRPILPGSFHAALSDTRWPDGALLAMSAANALGVPGIMDAESPVFEGAAALHEASHVAFSATAIREFTKLESLENAVLSADNILPGKVYATDGANGVFAARDGDIENFPAIEIEAVDTLGAGDVWHAAFAMRLGEGADDGQAIRFANAAAALKCTRKGGGEGAPTRHEVEEFLRKKL